MIDQDSAHRLGSGLKIVIATGKSSLVAIAVESCRSVSAGRDFATRKVVHVTDNVRCTGTERHFTGIVPTIPGFKLTATRNEPAGVVRNLIGNETGALICATKVSTDPSLDDTQRGITSEDLLARAVRQLTYAIRFSRPGDPSPDTRPEFESLRDRVDFKKLNDVR